MTKFTTSSEESLREILNQIPAEERAETVRRLTATILKDDLLTYIEGAWPLIEPQTPLISAKYLACICEHLTAVTIGKIKRLIINVPPRMGKSSIVSVLWPTWEWARDGASSRWIFATHSNDLSIRDSVRRRNVMTSSWYTYYWPAVNFSSDMNLKSEYATTNGGAMFSTFIGGALGRGGSRLVIDDPHNSEGMFSEAERERTINFARSSLFSRLDHPAKDAIVVVHSRLHENDLTGELLHPSDEGEAAMKQRLAEDAAATAQRKPAYSGFTRENVERFEARLGIVPPWWRR